MMRLLMLAGVLVVCSWLPGEAKPARRVDAQPYELVRTLQSVQERIAEGAQPALKLQAKLLSHIAHKFLAMPARVWKSPRNGRAAVLFVLSGGRPAAVRGLVERGLLAPPYDQLLKGALAFTGGDREEALEQLGNVDVFELPAAMGGHVALIKSALLRNNDAKRALEEIDRALLLMPATLVEESAIRRGAELAGDDGNRELFVDYSAQYLRRYKASLYRSDFQRKFAHLAVQLEVAEAPEGAQLLDDLLGYLDEEERRRLYLEVSRLALVKGSGQLARFSAGRASELSPGGSLAGLRAQAYRAAAGVVSDDHEKALETLRGLNVKDLPAVDRALVEAALALAEEVTRMPVPANAAADRPQVHEGEAGADDGGTQSVPAESQVIARAEKLFAGVDQLIERARQ